jgi:hypothetical protein
VAKKNPILLLMPFRKWDAAFSFAEQGLLLTELAMNFLTSG